jgi:alkylated DNA repair protein alkB family protein 1
MHYEVPYPAAENPTAAGGVRPSFFSYEPASDVVFTPKDASVHKPLSITQVMQKKLRWITLGGQYDWTNKIYPAGEPPQFPSDVAGLVEHIFPDMKAQAAIVNFYSPGDTLSLHRDVSEECDRGLASISIGCDCLFVIGLGPEDENSELHQEHDSSRTAVIRLRSGDAVYMSRGSRYAWHGVPKILSDTCPEFIRDWPAGEFERYDDWKGWMCNKRINLNVRQMRD